MICHILIALQIKHMLRYSTPAHIHYIEKNEGANRENSNLASHANTISLFLLKIVSSVFCGTPDIDQS
jgi:hypothetical protein